MPRKVVPLEQQVFAAWCGLTPAERAIFDSMVRGAQLASTGTSKPLTRRRKPVTDAGKETE